MTGWTRHPVRLMLAASVLCGSSAALSVVTLGPWAAPVVAACALTTTMLGFCAGTIYERSVSRSRGSVELPTGDLSAETALKQAESLPEPPK